MKIDKDLIKVIDTWLKYKWQYDKIAGVSIGILENNKIVYAKGFGYKDLEKRQKTTPLTTYRIASVSKVFTALGILKLVEQKKLRLDDRISKYLPELNHSSTRNITIKKLLLHTSLIARDGSYRQWETEKFPEAKYLFSQVKDGLMYKAPNAKWKYSNFGYSLLGILITRVSGVSYEDFMQKHILQPLKMNHTSSLLTDRVIKHLATGYTAAYPGYKQKSHKHSETYDMAGATGFSSNSEDLLKFGQAIINRSSKILKNQTWNLAFKKQVLSKEDTRNIFSYHLDKTGKDVWGHGGSYAGFTTRFNIDIKNKIAVVVLINTNSSPSQSYSNGIHKIIQSYQDIQKRLKKIKKIANPSKYEAHFAGRWGAFESISIKDRLIVFAYPSSNPLDDPDVLEQIQGNKFRIHSKDPYASDGEIAEFKFKNDKMIGIDWPGSFVKAAN